MNKLHTKHNQHSFAGFTLIELMVSMAVTIILVLFVNSIFATAGGAVRNGVAISRLIGATTIVTKQMDEDAQGMVGPRDGGFLVILNKRLKDVRLTPNDPSRDDAGSASAKANLPDLRVDQIGWIRSRGNLKPLAPGGILADPSSSYSSASHVRIWYGHCLITETDGSTPDNDELGETGTPNEIGINFVLGRQALFLDGSITNPIGVPQDKRVQVYADSAIADANVVGDGLGQGAPTAKLYMGLTDIAAQSLDDIRRKFGTAASSGTPQMARLAASFVFGSNRLHANPDPSIEEGYENWQIAQMHPIFVNHVSEMEVSFAGDYEDNDGRIDMVTIEAGGQGSGSRTRSYETINWYDAENPPTGGNLSENEISVGDYTGYAFVPGKNNWPHMVRIRFRAHDTRGQIAGPDGLTGQVYEVIIRVKRD